MDTYVDASYQIFLNWSTPPLLYMMPVSFMFYTNMPGYDKNWRWSSYEMLWYKRWYRTLQVQPRWIQIITWNDYGDSHYIGPLRGGDSFTAFGAQFGASPFNYAENMPHDGWWSFLPYMIDLYKTGTARVTHEGLTVWYRPHSSVSGCDGGGTTVNATTHLQPEHGPYNHLKDGVFFAAPPPTVKIGGTTVTSK